MRFLSLTVLLLLLLQQQSTAVTAAAADGQVEGSSSSSSSSSELVTEGFMQLNGDNVRRYRLGNERMLEPAISMNLDSKPIVSKTFITSDNSTEYFMWLPLKVEYNLDTGYASMKILQIESFRVELNDDVIGIWCSNNCTDISVAAVTDLQGEHKVLVRCRNFYLCDTMATALHFEFDISKIMRSAFIYYFTGVADGSLVEFKRLTLPVITHKHIEYLHMRDSDEYWFEGDKLLLYTIKAGSGHPAYKGFTKDLGYQLPLDNSWPDMYRSKLLNNLTATVKRLLSNTNLSIEWQMVAEMRKSDRVVARVVFDVMNNTDALTNENWFSTERLISSYPYTLTKSAKYYNYFSIAGDAGRVRRFFISHQYAGCSYDSGFWVVSEKQDECPWNYNGYKKRPPVLLVNTAAETSYYYGEVIYADHFNIYLQYKLPAKRYNPRDNDKDDFEFEQGKVMLFSVKANSNVKVYDAYVTSNQYSIPKSMKSLPAVYRSWRLEDMQSFKAIGKTRIVAEMRNSKNEIVSQIKFDISKDLDSINKMNWFNKSRILSSYPFNITADDEYNYFSIQGDVHYKKKDQSRRFYVNFEYGSTSCVLDRGFFAVLEVYDGCPWGHRGSDGAVPVLAYSVDNSVPYQNGSVRYADVFMVYAE